MFSLIGEIEVTFWETIRKTDTLSEVNRTAIGMKTHKEETQKNIALLYK